VFGTDHDGYHGHPVTAPSAQPTRFSSQFFESHGISAVMCFDVILKGSIFGYKKGFILPLPSSQDSEKLHLMSSLGGLKEGERRSSAVLKAWRQIERPPLGV